MAEITTTIRGIPQELPLGKHEGLPRPCVANLDALRSVERSLLGERIGALVSARHSEVKRALGYAVDWAELKALS